MKKPIKKRSSRQYDRHMSLEEFSAILEYLKAQEDFRFYTLFLAQSGLTLRICEALAIQWQDLTFGKLKTTIRVRLAKSDKILEKRVPNKLADLLFRYIQAHRAQIMARDGYLFYSFNHRCKTQHLSKGRAWQRLRECVHAIWGKAYDAYQDQKNNKYRIGTHSIRRLSITELLKHSRDIFFVQAWVGHGDIRVTQKYANYVEFLKHQETTVNEVFEKMEQPLVALDNNVLLDEIIEQKVKEKIEQILAKRAYQLS